jgi:hypothetical protein
VSVAFELDRGKRLVRTRGWDLVTAVRELARNGPWPKSSRQVIVAPVTVIYGVSRMYQLLGASDEALAVVEAEAEALEFLTPDRRSEGRPS